MKYRLATTGKCCMSLKYELEIINNKNAVINNKLKRGLDLLIRFSSPQYGRYSSDSLNRDNNNITKTYTVVLYPPVYPICGCQYGQFEEPEVGGYLTGNWREDIAVLMIFM